MSKGPDDHSWYAAGPLEQLDEKRINLSPKSFPFPLNGIVRECSARQAPLQCWRKSFGLFCSACAVLTPRIPLGLIC